MADAPDLETACRDAIRHCSSLQRLAEFASERHGYADTDGGFGVTYPGDLDEYAREVEGQFIPEGYLVIYGFWGPPIGYEMFVLEAFYLSVLAQVLAERSFTQESQQVQALAKQT